MHNSQYKKVSRTISCRRRTTGRASGVTFYEKKRECMNLTRKIIMAYVALGCVGLLSAADLPRSDRLPYPRSELMAGFSVDPERVSIGVGDNWPITWGDDNRQYAFVVDGTGFGAHGAHIRANRVSSSPVTIRGTPPNISGKDVPSVNGTFQRAKVNGVAVGGPTSSKVCGLLMIEGVLYAWVRNVNPPDMPKGTGSQLMVSKDYACLLYTSPSPRDS